MNFFAQSIARNGKYLYNTRCEFARITYYKERTLNAIFKRLLCMNGEQSGKQDAHRSRTMGDGAIGQAVFDLPVPIIGGNHWQGF
jgi:hypothetical protein